MLTKNKRNRCMAPTSWIHYSLVAHDFLSMGWHLEEILTTSIHQYIVLSLINITGMIKACRLISHFRLDELSIIP